MKKTLLIVAMLTLSGIAYAQQASGSSGGGAKTNALTTLTPSSAGSLDIGSSSKWFQDIYFGHSGSYYVKVTVPTLTANRTYTGPDADIILAGSAAAFTSTYVPFATTGGLLTGASSFTYQTGVSPNLLLTAASSSHVPLTIKGASAQATNLFTAQNNSGATLVAINQNGSLLINSTAGQAFGQTAPANTDGSAVFTVPTAAYTFALEIDTDQGAVGYVRGHGSGTGAGVGYPNSMNLYGLLNGGINFFATNASGAVNFVTGGTGSGNRRGSFGSSGGFSVGNGSPPAIIGSAATHGQNVAITLGEESLTIAAAATTDTAMQIPAGAIVLAVSVRVTTVIPTATTFTVTGASSGTTFSTASVSTAANTTNAGTAAGAYYNATAQSIRITPNSTPGAATGVVRVSVAYILATPPTS